MPKRWWQPCLRIEYACSQWDEHTLKGFISVVWEWNFYILVVFIIYYLFPYVPNDVHQILNGSPWCSSRVFSTAPQFISYLLLKVFPFRQGSKRVSTLSSHKNHYLGGASYLPLVFFFGFFLYVPIKMANC